MTTAIYAAREKSYDDFFAAFGSDDFRYVEPATQETTLGGALGNTDPTARYAIANRLLDEGADAAFVTAAGHNALHILLGERDQSFPELAALLQRLLDGGADVNLAAPKFGTPLQMLADYIRTPEAKLEPVYNVFFARDELDLVKIGAYRQSTLDLARESR